MCVQSQLGVSWNIRSITETRNNKAQAQASWQQEKGVSPMSSWEYAFRKQLLTKIEAS
jgi:hypothetical protein